jgi:hypothetical protein
MCLQRVLTPGFYGAVGGSARRGRLLGSAAMPVHRDRSRVLEARLSGLAIMLSVAALVLVLGYVVGGYANRVVVQVVFEPPPAASTQ